MFTVTVDETELRTLREGCLALELHWRAKVEAIDAISPNANAYRAEYTERQHRAAALYARLAKVTR